jgi:hypothetical protein
MDMIIAAYRQTNSAMTYIEDGVQKKVGSGIIFS